MMILYDILHYLFDLNLLTIITGWNILLAPVRYIFWLMNITIKSTIPLYNSFKTYLRNADAEWLCGELTKMMDPLLKRIWERENLMAVGICSTFLCISVLLSVYLSIKENRKFENIQRELQLLENLYNMQYQSQLQIIKKCINYAKRTNSESSFFGINTKSKHSSRETRRGQSQQRTASSVSNKESDEIKMINYLSGLNPFDCKSKNKESSSITSI